MKQKHRYRGKKKGDGLVKGWPSGRAKPAELALQVRYVGSAEHKRRPVDPSFVGLDPGLRSDASRCDIGITREQAEAALRQGVRLRCVSERFNSKGFPCYVWARLAGHPYAARLTNRGRGEYKGWPIEEHELPTDREGRLARHEGWP